MRRTEDERLLEALDFIDEVYVGELEKYYRKDNAAKRKTFVKATRWIAAGAALAACVLLVTLAIPKTKSVIQHFDGLIVFSPGNSDSFIEHTVTRVSDGLLYEISEDGESAYCVGFGTCTDAVVYIASTYEGLPVTEVYYENTVIPRMTPITKAS